MMTAEENYRLLQEIDANRRFLLLACRDNPALQARVDARARQIFGDWREDAAASSLETGAAGSKIAGSPT